MVTLRSRIWAGLLIGLIICGCTQSSPTKPPGETKNPTSSKSEGSTDKPETSTPATSTTPDMPSTAKSPTTTAESKSRPGYWEDYPDVPKVQIMTEVDGIKIPRMKASSTTLDLTGPIAADVGNEHAKRKPSEPVDGDTLTIRFNAEPKVMNPITENSAVMRYILEYVNEGLARENPETFVYEPWMAKNWIVEDSIKLAADYPGQERLVEIVGYKAQPAAESVEIDYEMPPSVDGKPPEAPKYKLKITDKAGQIIPHAWVGVFPLESIPGASTVGYHEWTDENGEALIGGFPAGKYVIKTGAEIFGQSTPDEDGSLKVTPGTAENPLKEPLVLKKGEWQDVQSKTYTTFYLRDDVKWSDGVPFTTKDLEFGYALLNSPFVDGDSIRTYYADLVECTPLGKYAIRMRYRQQYFKAPEFSYGMSVYTPPWHFFEKIFHDEGRELTLDRLTPAEEAAKKQISARGQEFGKFFNTDERYNSKPLGTGPYIVDKWERKDRIELVRNPNYWNPTRAGHVDRIIAKFIPDQVTAFAAMKAGEIDFLFDMSPDQYFEDWPKMDADVQQTYVRAAWYSPMFSYVAWNQLAAPFKDRRVRMALAMLFDRQEFIDKKMHGAGIVISGPQYLFGIGYDRDVAPVAYDPTTARELLTEAGWIDTDNDGILDKDGEKFKVKLQMPKGKPINEIMVEIIQKNFKNVGIEMQIQTMEWASFIDKLRAKECDVVTLRWAMSAESDPYQIWHSSGAARENRGSNTISFRNTKADELIELLRVTLDPDKRHRIHQSFHRVIDSEQPYLFLWTPKDLGAYHRRFRNVKWYRLRPGFDLSEWYVPKDEQLHK